MNGDKLIGSDFVRNLFVIKEHIFLERCFFNSNGVYD